MSQFSGGITVDEGYREAVAGSPTSRTDRVEVRARRSSPGAWDENLGRYGTERWELPGMGDKGPKCGEYYPEAVCNSCGEVDFGTHSCGRRSCPDCWGVWAKEAAVRATARLQAFRYTLPDNYERQAAHAVVSAPEGTVRNEREYYEGRKKAAEIAEEKGFRGYAVIPHPYRATEEGKREYRDSDADAGFWVWWRNETGENMDYVYWSPHYHIIGVTTVDMEEGKDSDEWLYAFINSRDPFEGIHDVESHKDIYGGFRYLLSHTGFPEGSTNQAVTWYGDLANSVFVENASEDWQHQKPSDGITSALEREIEEVAGVSLDDEESDESGGESDDVGECPCGDCDGVLIDVLDVKKYLRHNNPPPDVQHRMVVAHEWRMGQVSPPPGMKRPETEEHAREAFETML